MMPRNARVILNVGGKIFNISLHALIEGARQGGLVFQCLCLIILGPNNISTMPSSASTGGMMWENRIVSSSTAHDKTVHFVDMEPTMFAFWLDYLRTGDEPVVPAHLHAQFVRDTERIGLAKLASMMQRKPVPTRRVEVDVGGKVFATTYETLTRHGGYLKELLDCAGSAGSERIFIDRDPKGFRLILNWLRTGFSGESFDISCVRTMLSVLWEAVFYELTELGKVCLAQLEKLAASAGNKAMIAALGGDEAILKAEKAQEQAFERTIHDLNIGCIVVGMGKYMSNSALQQKACETLAHFTLNNADNKVKVAALGGIQALLKAMDEHPESVDVQEQACAALLNIGTSNGDRQQRIKRAGAAEQVGRAMAASNATDDTKKWGQMLLDRLANT